MSDEYLYRVIVEPGTTMALADGSAIDLEPGLAWTGTFPDHTSLNFPLEWRGRPLAGEWRLYISNDGDEFDESDELIGTQVPPDAAEILAFFAPKQPDPEPEVTE